MNQPIYFTFLFTWACLHQRTHLRDNKFVNEKEVLLDKFNLSVKVAWIDRDMVKEIWYKENDIKQHQSKSI